MYNNYNSWLGTLSLRPFFTAVASPSTVFPTPTLFYIVQFSFYYVVVGTCSHRTPIFYLCCLTSITQRLSVLCETII